MYLVLGGKYKLLGSNWYLKVSTSYLDSTWYLGVSTSYQKELVLKLQVTVLNTPLNKDKKSYSDLEHQLVFDGLS